MIDFFHQFTEGSRLEQLRREQNGKPDDRWFEHYTDLAGFAVGIDFEFPGEGLLNLVPAGRQSPDYAMLVQMFDWNAFYKDLGEESFLKPSSRNCAENMTLFSSTVAPASAIHRAFAPYKCPMIWLSASR
ncbi:MAG UNVERIFIED_CONTAM: hypothetical protein LVR18_12640 [Planctomycetaceae bacterium]